MKEIDLSVIIVNYKSWKLLTNCLDSFKEFPPKLSYEIIVVDNDSQDGRFDEFSDDYPDVSFIQNEGNYGFSHGCNLGADHAAGKYLLFLNPDTELTKDNAIDVMVDFIEKTSEVGIVSCRTKTAKKIERELLFSNPWFLIAFVRQLYKLFRRKELKNQFPKNADIWYPDWVTGSVVLISKVLFEEVGKWRQDRYWMYHEDPDLCIKVEKTGRKIALLRNVVINHVGGGASRKNSKTTILAKTEVLISSHNYIHVNAKAYTSVLHLLFAITSIIALFIKTVLSLIVFRFQKAEVYGLTIVSIIKYYFSTIFRGTWKSKKLDFLNIDNQNCSKK